MPTETRASRPSVLVLNGPNLNMLGTREPEVYGTETLADIEAAIAKRAGDHGLDVVCRQSNHEGELVTWIQEAREKAAAVIINAGAFTHTSIAILDALRLLDRPIIEVHLSNIHRREAYRHRSFVSEAADGVIVGLGSFGYMLAVDAVARLIGLGDQSRN